MVATGTAISVLPVLVAGMARSWMPNPKAPTRMCVHRPVTKADINSGSQHVISKFGLSGPLIDSRHRWRSCLTDQVFLGGTFASIHRFYPIGVIDFFATLPLCAF